MCYLILQVGTVVGPIFLNILLFFLLFGLVFGGEWLIRKESLEIDSVALRWISRFFIIILAGACLVKSTKLQIPSLPILIVEVTFVLFIFILFAVTFSSYRTVIKKQYKTDNDIRKRQKTIHHITYLLAISLTAVPFMLDSWGFHLLPSLESSYYMTQEAIIGRFINSGMKITLLVTIGVFFADNILNRIASEIYVYEDMKDLEKFCLYLRSFNIDKNKEEKLICKMTRNLYPVYAIGDPNKVLQPNGAERVYVTNEIWKDAVIDMSNRSKLILLRIGQTDGTMWEITNIINSKLVKKVIFIAYCSKDYKFFADKIYENMNLILPEMNFPSGFPIAFFFVDDNNSTMIQHFEIKKSKDVEQMLNHYLKVSPKLDKEYEQDLDLRNHNFRYMFDKERIPEKVRKSLNWGIISPIVNMRHWSIFAWCIFGVFIFISMLIMNPIPIYVYAFTMLLFGNRIEWAASVWSCASLFLRRQRREAKLLWLSMVLGILYSFIHAFMVLAFGNTSGEIFAH